MPKQKRPSGSAGNVQFIQAQPIKDPQRGLHRKGRTMDTAKDPVADQPAEEVDSVQPQAEPRPIPKMGWQATWYQIMLMFSKSPTPPRLSKKEVEANARAAAEAAQKAAEEAAALEAERKRAAAHAACEAIRRESIARLRQLSDEVPTLTVVFIGVKGAAGTTTTTAHVSSVTADLTRSSLVASDFNPASGTLSARLGKDYDQTITLRQLLADIDGFTNFSEFIRQIRPTRYSVRPISANDIVSGNEHLTAADAEKMLDTIGVNCEYHFMDTANDITTPVILEAIKRADVLVFTAYVGITDSLRQLGIGMQTVRKHGFEDKVDNSIVVITGIKSDESLEDYRKFLNRVNIRNEVIATYDFNGPFVQIPYDSVIIRDTEVDLDALAWETYQAYLDLAIVIFEQGRESQETAVVPTGAQHHTLTSAPENAPLER